METGDLELKLGKISIFLDMDPACSWTFRTQPGAIRRIIMNLFGNYLKYTRQGFIRLSLRQEAPKKKLPGRAQMVKLKVVDTGKGISEDYLRDELFSPFAQEDRLAPGTGLGLSLVKQITSQLKGSISVESCVGAGTTVSVSLPLVPVLPSPESSPAPLPDDDQVFEEQVSALKELRVRLVGSDRHNAPDDGSRAGDVPCSDVVLMGNICRGWLHMHVISDSQSTQLVPDLILCTEDAINEASGRGVEVSRPPTVVVCPNALIARQLSTSAEFVERPGVFEFIAQPTGPRKLAKVLLYAFKRWVDLQTLPPIRGSGANSLVTNAGQFRPNPTPSPLAAVNPDMPPSATSATSLQSKIDAMSPRPRATSSSTLTAPPMENMLPESQPVDQDSVFLLVDDNHINLKILASYMKKLGRPYVTATNGQEAVNTYRQSPARCNCIFMDISMPVMDGFEATRHIRALENELQLEPATIFALSGLASTDAQEEAFRSGIDLFLAKPVKLKEIGTILGSRGFL